MKSWNIFLCMVQLGAHSPPSRVSRSELQMAPTTVRDHGCTWSFLLLFGVGVLLLLQIIYEYSGYLKPCSRLHFPPLSRLHSLLTNKSSEIIPALKIYSLLCTKSVIESGVSERRVAENGRRSRRFRKVQRENRNRKMSGSISVAELRKSWKAVKWAGKLRPCRWGMWLFNHLLQVVVLSYIKEDLNILGCLWNMGSSSIWTIKTKDVGREWLTGLFLVAVPRSVEAAHPPLPHVSCNCVNRCVAFLFIWLLL